MNFGNVSWVMWESGIQAAATVVATVIAIIALVRQQRQAVRLKTLESELAATNFEHQTRFSKLHEKRGEVVAELYEKIVVLELWYYHIVLEAELPDEAFESPAGFAEDFDRVFGHVSLNLQYLAAYFNLNRLYLDEQLCRKIVHFHDLAFSDSDPVYGYFDQRFGLSTDEELNEIYGKDLHTKAYAVLENISELRRSIESEFRSLLGIEARPLNGGRSDPSLISDLMHIPDPQIIDPILLHKIDAANGVKEEEE